MALVQLEPAIRSSFATHDRLLDAAAATATAKIKAEARAPEEDQQPLGLDSGSRAPLPYSKPIGGKPRFWSFVGKSRFGGSRLPRCWSWTERQC